MVQMADSSNSKGQGASGGDDRKPYRGSRPDLQEKIKQKFLRKLNSRASTSSSGQNSSPGIKPDYSQNGGASNNRQYLHEQRPERVSYNSTPETAFNDPDGNGNLMFFYGSPLNPSPSYLGVSRGQVGATGVQLGSAGGQGQDKEDSVLNTVLKEIQHKGTKTTQTNVIEDEEGTVYQNNFDDDEPAETIPVFARQQSGHAIPAVAKQQPDYTLPVVARQQPDHAVLSVARQQHNERSQHKTHRHHVRTAIQSVRQPEEEGDGDDENTDTDDPMTLRRSQSQGQDIDPLQSIINACNDEVNGQIDDRLFGMRPEVPGRGYEFPIWGEAAGDLFRGQGEGHDPLDYILKDLEHRNEMFDVNADDSMDEKLQRVRNDGHTAEMMTLKRQNQLLGQRLNEREARFREGDNSSPYNDPMGVPFLERDQVHQDEDDNGKNVENVAGEQRAERPGNSFVDELLGGLNEDEDRQPDDNLVCRTLTDLGKSAEESERFVNQMRNDHRELLGGDMGAGSVDISPFPPNGEEVLGSNTYNPLEPPDNVNTRTNSHDLGVDLPNDEPHKVDEMKPNQKDGNLVGASSKPGKGPNHKQNESGEMQGLGFPLNTDSLLDSNSRASARNDSSEHALESSHTQRQPPSRNETKLQSACADQSEFDHSTTGHGLTDSGHSSAGHHQAEFGQHSTGSGQTGFGQHSTGPDQTGFGQHSTGSGQTGFAQYSTGPGQGFDQYLTGPGQADMGQYLSGPGQTGSGQYSTGSNQTGYSQYSTDSGQAGFGQYSFGPGQAGFGQYSTGHGQADFSQYSTGATQSGYGHMSTEQIGGQYDDESNDTPNVEQPDIKDVASQMIKYEYIKADTDLSPRAQDGLHTIIILDTSSAMDGAPFTEAVGFISQFLKDLEELQFKYNQQENVALVCSGSSTEVVQHFTNNYTLIRNRAETSLTGGESQLHLAMVLPFVLLSVNDQRNEQGSVYNVDGGHVVPPRVILITNGLFNSNPQDIAREKAPELLHHVVEDTLMTTYCVPVGTNCNMSFLESLSESTGGRVVFPAEVKCLSHAILHHEIVAKLKCKSTMEPTRDDIKDILKQVTGTADAEDVNSIIEVYGRGEPDIVARDILVQQQQQLQQQGFSAIDGERQRMAVNDARHDVKYSGLRQNGTGGQMLGGHPMNGQPGSSLIDSGIERSGHTLNGQPGSSLIPSGMERISHGAQGIQTNKPIAAPRKIENVGEIKTFENDPDAHRNPGKFYGEIRQVVNGNHSDEEVARVSMNKHERIDIDPFDLNEENHGNKSENFRINLPVEMEGFIKEGNNMSFADICNNGLPGSLATLFASNSNYESNELESHRNESGVQNEHLSAQGSPIQYPHVLYDREQSSRPGALPREGASREGNQPVTMGGNQQTIRSDQPQTSVRDYQQLSRRGNQQANRGGNQMISRGDNQQSSKGDNKQANREGNQQISREGNLQLSTGSNQQASRGANLQASRGANQQPSRGANQQANKGANQ